MSLKNLAPLIVVLVTAGIVNIVSANIADFDDLALAPNSYCNDSGGFTSGSAAFNNYATTGYWDGWAYSSKSQTSPVEKGMAGQYTAKPGTAQSGSNYGIAYVGFYGNVPTMTLNNTGIVNGLYVTNNNYAYYSMLEGDAFAKKFGGDSGNDEDWFLLTITGKDAAGVSTGTIDFYLADYRFTDDYIVNTWEYVDLTGLGAVKSIEFALDSSDHFIYEGVDYGMSTPAYFALDTAVPEPMTIVLFGLGGLLIRKRKI